MLTGWTKPSTTNGHMIWPSWAAVRSALPPSLSSLTWTTTARAEVLFSSWVEKGTGLTGALHILSYQGVPLHTIPLPEDAGGDWNGGLPAPTVANIDTDADLEVVVNTAATGLVAFDLPGTAQARVLWGTGRWNFQRSASLLTGSIRQVLLGVNRPVASPGRS